eukprot:gene3742-4316_t
MPTIQLITVTHQPESFLNSFSNLINNGSEKVSKSAPTTPDYQSKSSDSLNPARIEKFSLQPYEPISFTSLPASPLAALEQPKDFARLIEISEPYSYEVFLEKLENASNIKSSIDSFVGKLRNRRVANDDLREALFDFVSNMMHSLSSDPQWEHATPDESLYTTHHLQQYVIEKIYDYVFRSTEEEITKDTNLSTLIQRLQFIQPAHLEIPEAPHNAAMWTEAGQYLQKINITKSSSSGETHGADSLLPHLIYVVLQTNPTNLNSNVHFISRFSDSSDSEALYYMTQLIAVIYFIENIKSDSLKIEKKEFNRLMGIPLSPNKLSALSASTSSLNGSGSTSPIIPRESLFDDSALASLAEMFPDCDTQYLIDCITYIDTKHKHKSNGVILSPGDLVNRVTNMIAEHQGYLQVNQTSPTMKTKANGTASFVKRDKKSHNKTASAMKMKSTTIFILSLVLIITSGVTDGINIVDIKYEEPLTQGVQCLMSVYISLFDPSISQVYHAWPLIGGYDIVTGAAQIVLRNGSNTVVGLNYFSPWEISVPQTLNISTEQQGDYALFNITNNCKPFLLPTSDQVKATLMPASPYYRKSYISSIYTNFVPISVPGVPDQAIVLAKFSAASLPCISQSVSSIATPGTVGMTFDIVLPCIQPTIDFKFSNMTSYVNISLPNPNLFNVIDKFEQYPPNLWVVDKFSGYYYTFVTAHSVNSYFINQQNGNKQFTASSSMMKVQSNPPLYFEKASISASSIEYGSSYVNLYTVDGEITDSYITNYTSTNVNGTFALDNTLGSVGTTYTLSLEFNTNLVLYPNIFEKGRSIGASYPFGIVSGPFPEFAFKALFSFSIYSPSNIVFIYPSSDKHTEINSTYISPSAIIDRPTIIGFQTILRTASTAVYQIHAICTSGIQSIFLNGVHIKGDSLVSGDITDGIFEKEVPLSPDYTYVIVTCRSGIQQTYCEEDLVNFDFDFVHIEHVSSGQIYATNFTQLYFANNNIDTTNQVTDNTLYFSLNVTDKMYQPLLTFHNIDTFKGKQEFRGYWNETSRLYEIDFTVPMNMIDGTIPYTIKSIATTDSYLLYPYFGDKSLLQVYSSNGDLLPPLITQLTSFPGSIVTPSDTSFGWDMVIDDQISGVQYARFNVTSDLDLLPYEFTTDLPTAGSTTFSIRIPIEQSAPCINQTYSITGYDIIDRAGNRADSKDNGFDPFIKIRYTTTFNTAISIILQCPMPPVATPSPTESFCSKPDVCNGHGSCTLDSCVCTAPYFGAYCDNYIVPNVPEINPDTPTTVTNITDDSLGIDSSISVYALREINADGIAVTQYMIDSWRANNYTKPNGNLFFNYTSTVVNRPVNTESSCSMSNTGSNGDYDWMQLKVNGYTMYGQFIKLAMIDQRVVPITNSIETTSNSTYAPANTVDSSININIPYYMTSVLLDPNFSLLINTDPDKDNCSTGSSKKALSPAKLAGIIVGAVAFAAVAAIIGFRIRYLRNRHTEENNKLSSKLGKYSMDSR